MSPENRGLALKICFLLSLIYWGWNIAFNRIEYISPSAAFGLFEYIPFVFIIPLSFTLLYAFDCIRNGKNMVYVLFVIFFFILWSTPYLMEEQVRDWDAYWHGFASYRMSEGIMDAGNGVFSYASEFPGGLMFFSLIFNVIGEGNFIYFLKYVPILTILVTSMGIVFLFYVLEKSIPEKRTQLRYAMFLAVIINPFFSFHLSPQAYGMMIAFFLLAVIAMILKSPGAKQWRLYAVISLFLVGLAICHPTTLVFAFLLLGLLPFGKIFFERKSMDRAKLAWYLGIPLILVCLGILALLYIPQYMDSVMLNNMRQLFIGFMGTLNSLDMILRLLSSYTIASSIPSIVQKLFFLGAIMLTLYFYLMKNRTLILATMAVACTAYLVILVGLSGGFFLERAVMFLAIPASYAIICIDFKKLRKRLHMYRIPLDRRAVITFAIILMLFLPTFYWRECSVMFTDEETEAMKCSWMACGNGDSVELQEKYYPLFFLIGERNTDSFYDNHTYPKKVIINYDKSEWALLNLRTDNGAERYENNYYNINIIFSSEKITVYYLN